MVSLKFAATPVTVDLRMICGRIWVGRISTHIEGLSPGLFTHWSYTPVSSVGHRLFFHPWRQLAGDSKGLVLLISNNRNSGLLVFPS